MTRCGVSLGIVVGLVSTIADAADKPGTAKFRPVEIVSRGTVEKAKQPQAAVVGKDRVHVAFASKDAVWVATSRDAASTFAPPVSVAQIPALMAGMRRGPRIVADAQTIVVSAIGSGEGNLLAFRSTDGGETWESGVQVNDVAKSAREGLHAMAMGPKGQVACVWLDLRNQKTELACAVSSDGGAQWGENGVVYRSPDGSICECCHPSAAYDSEGTLFVLWRNQIGGNRDMYVASSKDDGRSFSTAVKLGAASWKKDSCPMDGGGLAVTKSGKAATVWRRDKEVFFTPAGATKEQRLGVGEQPWIAVRGSETYLAWVSRRPGSLMVKGPKGAPMEISQNALDPMLASGAAGEGPVVLVWETGKGNDTSIWASSLTGLLR